ncbi:hypothetical protein Bateq7PJ16_4093 [Bacillus subtilis]|nr:hypothetical protein Bateq7PJ16_4093 [Bacillus subtilis]
MQTSIHAFEKENSDNSSGVNSIAEFLLLHAGKTVSNRFSDTSR